VWIDIVVAARRCAAFGPGNASIFPRHARMNGEESFTHLVERHVLAIGNPFERIRSDRDRERRRSASSCQREARFPRVTLRSGRVRNGRDLPVDPHPPSDKEYYKAGYTHIYFHQVGATRKPF
jgi:hypothetical protein